MKSDLLEIRKWLRTRTSELFGLAEVPTSISIARHGSIIDASVEFAGDRRRIIIKRFPAASLDVAEFIHIHERLLIAEPSLVPNTPQFLACDGDKRWIAMDHVSGAPLESRLLSLARQGRDGLNECDALLTRAGRLLAQFHCVAAEEIGLQGTRRNNAYFVSSFQRLLARYRWQLAAAGLERQSLHHFLDRLSGEALNRIGDRVIPVDAQPKNILAADDGRLSFIDLAYCVGNPAMGAAQFLVSINRLRLRRPWLPASLFARWRAAFLDGYWPHVPSPYRRDLCFFYAWALLSTIEQHRKARPLIGRLAATFYARDFATYIAHTPRGQPTANPFLSSPAAAADPIWIKVCAPRNFDAPHPLDAPHPFAGPQQTIDVCLASDNR
jgi:hypothetical protein